MNKQEVIKRIKYLIDNYAGGNNKAFADAVGVKSSGNVGDWLATPPRSFPGPKVLDKVASTYNKSMDWIYGKTPLESSLESTKPINVEHKSVPDDRALHPIHSEDIAVYGTIKVTVEEYIRLREELAVSRSEARTIKHQNDKMIDGFAETLKSINNYIAEIHQKDNTLEQHGETTGQRIETDIGRSNRLHSMPGRHGRD